MKDTKLIAGAGIWGCTLARRFAEAGHRVLVLEKRPVVGGNVRCETDEATGIEIHRYGSHIFHTHLPEVWEFVNRFVRFNGYQHKVLARYRGRTYFLPFGLAMINQFFGVELKPAEVRPFLDGTFTPPTMRPDATVAADRRQQAVFDAFFRGYTSKQWGMPPEEIDPSIIRRVPVRTNYDVNYFNDYNQGIPATGYNSLFERLLDHPAIEVKCGCALVMDGDRFAVERDGARTRLDGFAEVYYSGPIDALFGYRFGYLPWRTLRFETETLDLCDFQGTSVVNYTEAEIPYTRIHEFKHYHPEGGWGFDAPKTVIMREYSATWKPGDEPYYPVDTADSREALRRYRDEVSRFNATSGLRLTVGGRLGEYKYYDMDKSVQAALRVNA